jgi:hypothetical protein
LGAQNKNRLVVEARGQNARREEFHRTLRVRLRVLSLSGTAAGLAFALWCRLLLGQSHANA